MVDRNRDRLSRDFAGQIPDFVHVGFLFARDRFQVESEIFRSLVRSIKCQVHRMLVIPRRA